MQSLVCRYGALPVVRATGGLADTVFDVDDSAPPPEGQHPNGFTFAGADEASEDSALDRAFRCPPSCPRDLVKMRITGASDAETQQ